ncbi:MAG: hypothetical protein AAB403_21505 [Planctomycetota bacterium]
MPVHGFSSLLVAAIFAGMTAGACELSFRDQVLLIQISEAAPPAGRTEIASMAGAELECAELGLFRIVRHRGSAMHVLDPRRAFNRWGQTGISFTGGPSQALRIYLYVYKRSDPLSLWREFGRGRFGEEELAMMSITGDTVLPWQKVRLLDAGRYRAAMAERVSPEEERLIDLLLREKARWYMAANAAGCVEIIDISPGAMFRYAPEAIVTVSYRQKQGPARKLVLRVPINPAMPPYVGYPTKNESDITRIREPLTGGGVPPNDGQRR